MLQRVKQVEPQPRFRKAISNFLFKTCLKMSSGGRIPRLTSTSKASASRPTPGKALAVACPAPKTPKMDDNSTTIEFIEKFLECGVCLDFSTSPIHSCDNAHILCGQCAPKFSACPTCQNPKLGPNPVCEKLAKEVTKVCY